MLRRTALLCPTLASAATPDLATPKWRGHGAKPADRDAGAVDHSQSHTPFGSTHQLDSVGATANQPDIKAGWVGIGKGQISVGLDSQLEVSTGPTVGIGWLITHSGQASDWIHSIRL